MKKLFAVVLLCISAMGMAQELSKDAVVEIGVIGDAKNFRIRTYFGPDVQNPAQDITWERLSGNRVAFIVVPTQEYMVSKEGFKVSKIKLSPKDPLFSTYGSSFSNYNELEQWAEDSLGESDGDVSGGVDQQLFLNDALLTISGDGGNTVDLSGLLDEISSPNNGELFASNYGIVGDGVTDNTLDFRAASTISTDFNMDLVFGVGTFLINAEDLTRPGLSLKGAGEGRTIFKGNGTANTNFMTVTEGLKVEGITFEGYDRIFYSETSLDELIFIDNNFRNNRAEVYYSAELPSRPNSHIEKIILHNNEIVNTPGIYHNGTYEKATVTYNYIEKPLVDLSIYPDETLRTRNWGIQLGNAYSANGSLTYEDTQELMGSLTSIGNTLNKTAVPLAAGIDLLGLFYVGRNISSFGDKSKDWYDTNSLAEDVSGLYTKAYNLSINGGTWINTGSRGYIGEGSVTIKGYNKDGLGGFDGSQDAIAFNQIVSNNTFYADIDGFDNAMWVGSTNENVNFNNNIVHGYNRVTHNIPNNSKFSGNHYSKMGEIYDTNTTTPLINVVFENETILWSPTDQASPYYFRKGFMKNVTFSNINITANLENFTGSSLNMFRYVSNASQVNEDVNYNNIKLRIENSNLTGNQYLFHLPFSGATSTHQNHFKFVDIKTDGIENWSINNESLAEQSNTTKEFFTFNNIRLIGALGQSLDSDFADIDAVKGINQPLFIGSSPSFNGENITNIGGNASVADGSITTVKIADDAITQAKLADDSVGGDQIRSGTIGSGNLGNGAVTIDKINSANLASKAEAEAGTSLNRIMTALRVKQAIDEWANKSGTTADRPVGTIGRTYWDTDLQKLIIHNGTTWVNPDGTSL